MTGLQQHQELCQQFAAMLNYPDDQLAARAAACAVALQQSDSFACVHLARFRAFLEQNDCARIEEAFTGTFDLQANCHPYVGYQLCGESQQRTMLMIKLRELYRQYDFTPGNELPDHLCEVLRFLGSITDLECRNEIIEEGLLPALAKMIEGDEADGRPYLELIKALQGFLTESAATADELPALGRRSSGKRSVSHE